jgi:hypothetical protein
MQNCEAFKEQLLESLYDLLEEPEKQALAAHLQSCQPCQAELERARRQQGLLAAAARMEFPQVQFTPPQSEVTADPPLVAPLAPTRARRRPRWARWIAAAAALFLVIGLGSIGGWYLAAYQPALRTVVEHEEAIANARQAIDYAIHAENALHQERAQRKEKIWHDANEKKLRFTVRGPKTVQAGAPNNYQIEVSDFNQAPGAAKVSANVIVNGVAVGPPIEARRANKDGVYALTLPPDVPIRPDTQPTLVVSATPEAGVKAEVSEVLKLTAPVYLTHLTTDKPMYLPGETVYFRSLTLDRATLKPPQEDFHIEFVLTSPVGGEMLLAKGKSQVMVDNGRGGEIVRGPDGQPVRGVGVGEWKVPDDPGFPGGEYVVTVKEVQNRFPEQRRKFLVNNYQKPRLNKELDYNRTTYGAGDEVIARCKARTSDDKPLRDTNVQVQVQVDGHSYGPDGKETGPFTARTDSEGAVNVRFKLPQQIALGQGTLTVTFQDEPLSKPIPIVLKKLTVEIYPEGGDLVAGVLNRVYFQVRTPLGKPAELKGRLLEDGKPTGITLETLHDDKEPGINQGMGLFDFTPKLDKAYAIEVERPAGITQKFPLPLGEALKDRAALAGNTFGLMTLGQPIQTLTTGPTPSLLGAAAMTTTARERVALSVPGGVFSSDGEIPVVVRSVRNQPLVIGAYCRGRLLDTVSVQRIHYNDGTARVSLKPTSPEGGVCRITAFEQVPGRRAWVPVAERLVYRQPKERLNITLSPDKQAYVPRDAAKLGISVTNEKGEAAPAIVMLAVVDKSVVTLADEKTARTMPTHFLLTTEVRRPEDLEQADFLLGTHPRAAEALDLLLGTQGWRRFAEQSPTEFRENYKEEADRLLVAFGHSNMEFPDSVTQQLAAVERDIDAKQHALTGKIEAARESARSAEKDQDYATALVTLNRYDDFVDRGKRIAVPIGACLLAVLITVLLFLAVQRRPAVALGLSAAVAVCFGGFLLLVAYMITHRGDNAGHKEREMAMLDEPTAAIGDLAERRAGDQGGEGRAPMNFDAFDGAADDARPDGLNLAPHAMPKVAKAIPGPARPMDADWAEGKVAEEDKAQKAGWKGKEKKDQFMRREGDGKGRDKEAGAFRMPPADRPMARNKPGGLMAPLAGRRGGLGGGFAGGGMPAPAAPPPLGLPAGGPMGRDMEFERARLLREQEQLIASLPPLVLREYAHLGDVAKATGEDKTRTDYTETLYWHPVLVLPQGKTEVNFKLCDSVTSFEAVAYAHSLDGRLGAAKQLLVSRLPIVVRHKTPLEVTAGDRLDLPVSISNNSGHPIKAQVLLGKHDNLELVKGDQQAELTIAPDKTLRRFYGFQPMAQQGEARLRVEAKPLTGNYDPDAAEVGFRIVPQGFPIVDARSDVLENSASQTVVLPEKWLKGTLQCRVNVYPSTLADLQKGLEAMLREPCGCFEQTSTSNYPNLLVLDYLKESDLAKPELERRARDLLTRGYSMLTSFECTNTAKHAREGYEWFGGTAPAHEALTAYGLMEFRDMARVHEVDPVMLKRTSEYLMSRRDGKGGFLRNDRALDTFGAAPPDITNAYIVWALTESGKDDDITKELAALTEQAEKTKDPYFLALVANSLINRARTADGKKLLEKVAGQQKEDGHLDAERTSITHSSGRDLQIETTALAVLGWLKANPGAFQQPLAKAIKWLGQQRGGYGGFGSTQATILTLKALIAYTKANKKTAEAGKLRLLVDDKEVAHSEFPAGAADALTLEVPNADTALKPGKNKVRVEITGKNVFPYTLAWSYNTLQPASADKCPVRLETSLARTEEMEGRSVRMTVKLSNVSGQGQGMAVAIIGLPGGLGIPEDMKQLKEHVRVPEDGSRPLVSAFEARGRELVLYWRDLAPGQKIEVPVDLLCRVPGEYSGPASRAYLYYNADHKHWVTPLKMTIKPQAD